MTTRQPEARHSKHRDESGKSLDAFKKAYNEELATASAVTYWRDKAVVHRWLAALSGGLTGLLGLLYFGAALPFGYSELIATFEISDVQPEWRLAIAVVLVLIGIWLLRIMVRIFLSQVHLASDASHRRITLLSYIALLKNEQQAVTPEDRSIVLETIFRPTSDGIVRDDAMPPSPWELLTRQTKA